MDEDEKEGREEVCVCVCVVRWRACVCVCVGEAVDFAIRSACDLQNVTHSKRPSKLSSGLIPTTAGSVSRM